MILNLISNSAEETKKLGEKLGSILTGSELILLSGDLGMGKTLLTKGIAKGLNIPENEIVSPTFTLQNRYYSEKTDNYLYHFDLYRLGDNSLPDMALTSPEIDDYLGNSIIVVEWAQYLHKSYFKVPEVIIIDISIQNDDLDKRSLKIESELQQIRSILKD